MNKAVQSSVSDAQGMITSQGENRKLSFNIQNPLQSFQNTHFSPKKYLLKSLTHVEILIHSLPQPVVASQNSQTHFSHPTNVSFFLFSTNNRPRNGTGKDYLQSVYNLLGHSNLSRSGTRILSLCRSDRSGFESLDLE